MPLAATLSSATSGIEDRNGGDPTVVVWAITNCVDVQSLIVSGTASVTPTIPVLAVAPLALFRSAALT